MTDSSTVASFRRSVIEKAGHLPEAAVAKALEWYVDHHKTDRRFEKEVVEWAGILAEQAKARPTSHPRGPQPVRLEDTPLAEHSVEEWRRVLRPLIEDVRESVWGSPDAPWLPHEWDLAHEWLRSEEERGRSRLGVPEGASLSDAADALLASLEDQLPALCELTGWGSAGISRTEYRVRLRSRDGGQWTVTQVTAFGSPALRRIARCCGEVATVTGFDEWDVTAWVLFEVVPDARRATIETRYATIALPGGHAPDPSVGDSGRNLVRSARVVVAFLTPDVTNDDLRRIRQRIERAWALDGSPEDEYRPTWGDIALERAIGAARVSDPPSGAQEWELVQEAWAALAQEDARLPDPPASGESCRRYYYRLQKKKQQQSSHIMEGTNG